MSCGSIQIGQLSLSQKMSLAISCFSFCRIECLWIAVQIDVFVECIQQSCSTFSTFALPHAGRPAHPQGALSRQTSETDRKAEVLSSVLTDRGTTGTCASTSSRGPINSSAFQHTAASSRLKQSANGGNSAVENPEQPSSAAAADHEQNAADTARNVASDVAQTSNTDQHDLPSQGRGNQSHATGYASSRRHQQTSSLLDKQMQGWKSEHASTDPDSSGKSADGAEWWANSQEDQQQGIKTAVDGLSNLSSTLVRQPVKEPLKSVASLYAASGVVDELFTEKQTYVNGGVEPMTRPRHQYGLSPRQMEEEREKRKEFASNLSAWYKVQLQRRLRNNASGFRTISRSNSKITE